MSKDKDNGIAYQLILFFLTFPLSLIIGRWMPEMILPFGNGFSAHGILSFLLGYVILSIILNFFGYYKYNWNNWFFYPSFHAFGMVISIKKYKKMYFSELANHTK